MISIDDDQKLAEQIGYTKFEYDIIVVNGQEEAVLMVPDEDKGWRYFRSAENMSDAWELAERFGLTDLIRHPGRNWVAWFHLIGDSAETAPLAICKAALKVAERRKSDE